MPGRHAREQELFDRISALFQGINPHLQANTDPADVDADAPAGKQYEQHAIEPCPSVRLELIFRIQVDRGRLETAAACGGCGVTSNRTLQREKRATPLGYL
jgi:hypothetical protein